MSVVYDKLLKRPLLHRHDSIFVTVGFSDADYIVDGTADNVQIQAAIDYVNSTGKRGTVFLLPGIFSTTAALIHKSNVSLMGSGIGVTIIRSSASDFNVIKTTINGTSKTVYENISLMDLSLESSHGSCCVINNTNGVNIFRCEFYFNVETPIRQGIYLQHCKNINIQNNIGRNLTGNGISVTGSDYFNISFNSIDGGELADDLIDVDIDFSDTLSVAANHGVVTKNVLRSSGRGQAIRVESGNYVTVEGNEISDVSTDGGAGILVNQHSSVPTSTNVCIQGNVVSNCLTDGIRVSGSGVTNVTVAGNILDTCGQDGGSNLRGGITIQSVGSGISVHNNTLDNCGKNDGDGGAIIIYKSNNLSVEANTIVNSDFGVRIWNGDGSSTYSGLFVVSNKMYSVTTNYPNVSSVLSQSGVNIEEFNTHESLGNITGSVTFNVSNGTHKTATVTGNITATLSNGLFVGQILERIFTMGGSGSYTYTKASNEKLVGGALTLTTAVGSVDKLSLMWNGTNWYEVSRSLNLS